jgi:hypothetical protein
MAKKNTPEDAPSQRVNRLSIPLKEDGTVDVDQMRPSTREKFVSAIHGSTEAVKLLDPDGAKEVGLDASPIEDTPDLFAGITLENIRTGLDILSSVNARVFTMMAGRFVKHPIFKDAKTGKSVPMQFDGDLVSNCFKLTAEQHAELDPRVLRIAQKHNDVLPEWFKKHVDIYMAATMFLKYQGENTIKVIQAQVERDVKLIQSRQPQQPQSSKPNGKVIIPTEPQPIRITEDPQAGATA